MWSWAPSDRSSWRGRRDARDPGAGPHRARSLPRNGSARHRAAASGVIARGTTSLRVSCARGAPYRPVDGLLASPAHHVRVSRDSAASGTIGTRPSRSSTMAQRPSDRSNRGYRAPGVHVTSRPGSSSRIGGQLRPEPLEGVRGPPRSRFDRAPPATEPPSRDRRERRAASIGSQRRAPCDVCICQRSSRHRRREARGPLRRPRRRRNPVGTAIRDMAVHATLPNRGLSHPRCAHAALSSARGWLTTGRVDGSRVGARHLPLAFEGSRSRAPAASMRSESIGLVAVSQQGRADFPGQRSRRLQGTFKVSDSR